MSMIIWGAIVAIGGVFLTVVGNIMENDRSYQFGVYLSGDLYWGRVFFVFGIVLIVAGALLFIVGLVKYIKDPNPSNPFGGMRYPSEPLLTGAYREDPDLAEFLEQAKPESRASELNVLWFHFNLNKRYPAASKALLSLMDLERRNGKNEAENRIFLSKLKDALK